MTRAAVNEERREQIMLGLLEVMARHGYDGASTKAIAAAAGLGAGLVHYHFKSKQEILLGLVDLLTARLEQRVARFDLAATTPRQRLDAFLDAHLALGDDADPAAVACWVTIGAEALRQPEVAQLYRGAIQRDLTHLRLRVAAVFRDRGAEETSADEIAAALMAATLGTMQLALAAGAAPKGFAATGVKRMATGLLAAVEGRDA